MKSDVSGEFQPLTKHLTELGMVHRLTRRQIYHQSGSVERKHIEVITMGLTLLVHAFIRLIYWDHNLLCQFILSMVLSHYEIFASNFKKIGGIMRKNQATRLKK